MQIIGTAVADGTSFKPPISQPACISAADKGIPVPKAWPIDNKKDSYLFVFQLLPQKATLIYDKDGKMTMDKPHEGTPKCKDGLFIKFVSSNRNFMIFNGQNSLSILANSAIHGRSLPSSCANNNANANPNDNSNNNDHNWNTNNRNRDIG
jgi:hypothetical protein